MNKIKIGINGFGRIGRMILRAYFESINKYNSFEITYVNDLTDNNTNIHLLKHDSVHGFFNKEITQTSTGMIIDGQIIEFTSEANPEHLDWAGKGVDLVFECSGRFTKKTDASKHLLAGAKKVIISAPSEVADKTVVFGINHSEIQTSDSVISNGSCTTNCLAPIAYILDKEFGIEHGFMTTIHSYTGDQRLIDTAHKDLRRTRAAALSIIPSTTGAARAVGLVLPQLKGKLDGTALRVPTPNVSLIDLVCNLSKSITIEDVNNKIKEYSKKCEFQDILGYCDELLVSIDFNHSTKSSVFDATGTVIMGDKLCRVVSWYDNEFGFSNRMLDLAQFIVSNNKI